jgi:predicted transposase/invertase (TIGR01784 family)
MYSPKSDIVFKKLFFTEENKDLLIDLINAFLRPEDHITDVFLKNPYNSIDTALDKQSYMDVKALDQKGNMVLIEMQVKGQTFYKKRALYYWAEGYTNQLDKSEQSDSAKNYSILTKVISIHIVNFILEEEKPEYHNYYRLIDQKNRLLDQENLLELHFLEIPKVKEVDLKEHLTLWVEFFNNPNSPKIRNASPIFEKAVKKLKIINFTEQEKVAYDKFKKQELDELARLDYAEQEGIKKGEHKKAMDAAKKMIIKGLSLKDISEFTGLSMEEINSLKN